MAPISLLVLCQAMWHWAVDDLTCVCFTPNIRTWCKRFFQQRLEKKHDSNKITIHDGFHQQVNRFLFEPFPEFWDHREKIEVQTMLPDGNIESKSLLYEGKGVFGFTCAEDLDATKPVQAPYSFLRDDKSRSKAVVRLWSKSVDIRFRKHFERQQIDMNGNLIDDPSSRLKEKEKDAFDDFKRALTGLLTAEGLREGRMWKCTEEKTIFNKHLAIEGQLCDVIELVKQHPLAARHYFRCSVAKSSIEANLGFGKSRRKMSPGKPETSIVLYTRQGKEQHAQVQTLFHFTCDTRAPKHVSNQIVGDFGRCPFRKLDKLGAGGCGEVYLVRRDSEKFALKLALKDEKALAREKSIADLLQHRFFMKIHGWGVKVQEGQIFPGPQEKGILLELGDENLNDYMVPHAEKDGKHLELHWLQRCRPFMAQIVVAMEYMHQKKVIHRDLKPENMVLKRKHAHGQADLEIMLIDYGSAMQFPDHQLFDNAGTPVCPDEKMRELLMKKVPTTPLFRPPQVERRELYGMKFDVYCAGMTFDAMLRRFCRKNSKDRWIVMPKYVNWSPPPDSPREVQGLLTEMLQPDERNRYGSSDLLRDEFFGESFTWRGYRFPPIRWQTYN